MSRQRRRPNSRWISPRASARTSPSSSPCDSKSHPTTSASYAARVVPPAEPSWMSEGRCLRTGIKTSSPRASSSWGPQVAGTGWLVNVVDALVPAGKLGEVADWSEVVSLDHSDPNDEDKPMYDGAEVRTNVRASVFHSANYRGDSGYGGDSDANIRLAIIETAIDNDFVNRDHDGFKDSASGPSRVKAVYSCTSSGCGSPVSNTGSGDNHATRVTWIAAGSIEQNQDPTHQDADPAYPGTTAQVQRSGVEPETDIYFLRYASRSNGKRQAIEKAVALGADVYNLSAGSDDEECRDVDTRTYDSTSMNAALANALAAGTLPVHVTGNEADDAPSGACSAVYPSWRPEAVAVGSLDTPDAQNYTTAQLGAPSGRGYARTNITLSGNPIPALTAPGLLRQNFIGTSQYNSGQIGAPSTSYAAPIVAGGTALLKEALYENGNFAATLANGRRILVNLLLSGDGWYVNGLSSNTGSEEDGWVSGASGYGKVRLHHPGELSGPSFWSSQVRTINQGTTIWWPAFDSDGDGDNDTIPSGVTQLKWALAWFPSSLNDAGAMSAQLVQAACNSSNPTSGTIIGEDATAGFRKRLQASGSAVANKCIWLVVEAFDTPGSSTSLYSALYFHSGTTGAH